MTDNSLIVADKQAIALNGKGIDTLAFDATKEGGKGVNSLVAKALATYHQAGKVLHHTACAAIFHAFQTGDSRPLTSFHAGLRQNDADALRIWSGKLANVTISDDGVETITPVLTFKKDSGFAVKKGTENLRVGYLDLAALVNGPSFQDVNQAKESVYDLKKLLAMLMRIEKQAEKKSEEFEFEIPVELLGAIKGLTATANRVSATLN
jgi:hypothetical protein